MKLRDIILITGAALTLGAFSWGFFNKSVPRNLFDFPTHTLTEDTKNRSTKIHDKIIEEIQIEFFEKTNLVKKSLEENLGIVNNNRNFRENDLSELYDLFYEGTHKEFSEAFKNFSTKRDFKWAHELNPFAFLSRDYETVFLHYLSVHDYKSASWFGDALGIDEGRLKTINEYFYKDDAKIERIRLIKNEYSEGHTELLPAIDRELSELDVRSMADSLNLSDALVPSRFSMPQEDKDKLLDLIVQSLEEGILEEGESAYGLLPHSRGGMDFYYDRFSYIHFRGQIIYEIRRLEDYGYDEFTLSELIYIRQRIERSSYSQNLDDVLEDTVEIMKISLENLGEIDDQGHSYELIFGDETLTNLVSDEVKRKISINYAKNCISGAEYYIENEDPNSSISMSRAIIAKFLEAMDGYTRAEDLESARTVSRRLLSLPDEWYAGYVMDGKFGIPSNVKENHPEFLEQLRRKIEIGKVMSK